MANPFCTLPQSRNAFGISVVNKLTNEQKDALRINDDNKADSTKAVGAIAKAWLEMTKSEDDQNRKLSSPEEFIPRLLEKTKKGFTENEEYENAVKELEAFEQKYGKDSKYGFSHLVTLESDSAEQRDEDKVKFMAQFPTITEETSSWVEKNEEGEDVYFISVIIKQPFKADQLSAQEKVIQSLNKLFLIGEDRQWLDYEVRNTISGKTAWLSQHKNKDGSVEDGWEKTGRIKWIYKGKVIISNSVSNEVHGFKERDDTREIYNNLGDIIDAFGRDFFDKDSDLWRLLGEHMPKLLSKDKLEDEERAKVANFISDYMQDVYTVEGFRNILRDFSKLKEEIDKRWPDAKVYSKEVWLFSKLRGSNDYVNGIPDLLIVDKSGKIHVLDFKTWKIGSSYNYGSLAAPRNSQFDRERDYAKQISLYIRILQSLGFDVEEAPYLVQVDTYYITSKNDDEGNKVAVFDVGKKAVTLQGGVPLNQYIADQQLEGQDVRTEVIHNVENVVTKGTKKREILYIEPRLHLGYNEEQMAVSDEFAALRGGEDSEELQFDSPKSFEQQYESLDDVLKATLMEFSGPIVHRGLAQEPVRASEEDIDSRPELISTDEMQCIAEGVMYKVASYITGIQKNDPAVVRELAKRLNGMDEKILNSLKNKTRKHIIRKLGIADLVRCAFDYYIGNQEKKDFPILSKEQYEEESTDGYWDNDDYDFYSWKEYERARIKQERIQWLKGHYGQFVMKGQRKLKALENTSCPVKMEDSTLKKEGPNLGIEIDDVRLVDDEGDNETLSDFMDRLSEGISYLEAWMMGQRNFSPKASLAKEVRRMFEDIIVVEEDGGYVYDRYGWQIPQHLNATKAIQACLDICKNCETWEEMRDALASATNSSQNTWIKQVLDILDKDERMRAKFYGHMYKDPLVYSVAEFRLIDGKRVMQTRVINQRSAFSVMSQSLNASFFGNRVGSYVIEEGLNPVSIIMKEEGTNRNVLTKLGGKDVVLTIMDEAKKLLDVYMGLSTSNSEFKRQLRSSGPITHKEFVVKKLKEYEFAKKVGNLLRGIGILVTDDVVENAIMFRPEQIASGNLRTLLDSIQDACDLLREMSKEKEGIPNGTKGNKAFRAYAPIIQTLADFVQEHIEASSYQDGKTYYTYTNPSRLNHIVRNLTDPTGLHRNSKDSKGKMDRISQFIYDNYGRYAGWFVDREGNYMVDWLAKLTNFRERKEARMARKALKHKVELSFSGNPYEDLGPLDFQRSLLHNYFGSRADEIEGDGNYRWFGMPTMSNKPTNEFLRMLKYGSDSKDSRTAIVEDVLMQTFRQEMNRIADTLWHYACRATPTDQIDLIEIGKDKNGNEQDKLRDVIKAEFKGLYTNKSSKEIDEMVTKEINEFRGYNIKDDEGNIVHVKGRIENQQITLKDLKRLFQTVSGAKFHFLWYLNNDVFQGTELENGTLLGDALVERLNLLLSPQDSEAQKNKDTAHIDAVDNAMEKLLGNDFDKLVEAELLNMEAIGLTATEGKRVSLESGKSIVIQVPKYQSEFNGKMGELSTGPYATEEAAKKAAQDAMEQFKNGLREYIRQDIAANINIIQITGGDLAYFGNSVNYQKRIAMFHSPGIHLLSTDKDDGFFRSVHISDYSASKKDLISEVKENALVALERYKNGLETQQQKEEYQMMINIIASGFDKIDYTDGQSFGCLSSERKKLSAMGEWSDEDEEVYKKVLNGDLSMENLGKLMKPKQPRKPFVASDMAKYSGSPTMTLRKVPLQDKNSEYLIILAEALSRQSGKRSRLAAISDFMEATHKDGDHRHGIDTVHFVSVGKVGATGVIDIHEFDRTYDKTYEDAVKENAPEIHKDGKLLSKEDAYNALLTKFMLDKVRRKESDKNDPSVEENFKKMSDAIKGSKDKETLMKPEELYYDTDYVDTIPINDYIKQQEVPAHLLDEREQLYGSQIRILGISDITPGTEFRVWNAAKGAFEILNDKKLVEEYKDLHAANIWASFDDLMQELKLEDLNASLIDEKTGESLPISDADPEKRTKFYEKLAELIQQELTADGKYSIDEQKACRLVRTAAGVQGFVIPPIDPTHASRIQMLLNSIIKKRINNQTINGGPVVQTTAYDNRLHIRFQDTEGNLLDTFEQFWENKHPEIVEREDAIKEFKKYLDENQAGIAYYECYMPLPDPALEKLVTNPDGTYMSYNELFDHMEKGKLVKGRLPKEVQKSLSEAIGYRIPTEDKYSMIPLKIMGFVPKAAGEVIMLPQEITYLTGSDFDIDKLYIMKKSFNRASITQDENKPNIVVITQGTRVTKIDLNNFPGIARGEESFIKVASKLVRNMDRVLSGYPNAELFDGMSEKEQKLITEQYINFDVGLPSLLQWLRRAVLEEAFQEATDQNSIKPSEAHAARNNRILDLQWSVLTNADTVSKMLNPGNFDPQKRVGRMIRIIKEGIKDATLENWEDLYKKSSKDMDGMLDHSNPHSVTLPSSKIYFQRQNMQGTQMVGIFANNNVSHAFMTFQRVGIVLNRGNRDRSFYFDGEQIGGSLQPTILDPQKDRYGQLISKTIASFLAASVDTAKDPTLADMNVNTFTGGVAMALARMGFGVQEIGLFLSQPIIMQLTDLYFKNKSSQDYYTGNNAIEEMLATLNIDKQEFEDLSDIQGSQGSMTLTKENLIQHLADKDFMNVSSGNTVNRDYQISVLKAFDSLLNIARDLQDLTFCTKFNSVSNAVGPTIADSEEEKQKVTRFFARLKEGKSVFYIPSQEEKERAKNGDQTAYTHPADILGNDPILNAFYETTLGHLGISRQLFKHLFLHYSRGFQNVKDFFEQNYLKSGKMDAKLYNRFLGDYIYYCLTYRSADDKIQPVLPYDNIPPENEETGDLDYLVLGIVDRYKEILGYKDKRTIPNMILDQHLGNNCLRIREADEYMQTRILEFNSSQVNAENEDEVRRAWDALLQMDDPNLTVEENQNIQRFGVDLFFYSLLRNAFTFGPKTMMHLATTIVKLSARFSNRHANYVEGLYNLTGTSDALTGSAIEMDTHMKMFCDMFVRNHSNNKTLVPFIEADSDLISPETVGENVLELKVPKTESYRLKPYTLKDNNPIKFINVVYRDSEGMHYDFYQAVGDIQTNIYDEKLITFTKVSRLGITNQFVEYNANDPEGIKTSYYDKIRGISEAGFEEEASNEETEKVKEPEVLYDEDADSPFWRTINTEMGSAHAEYIKDGQSFNKKYRDGSKDKLKKLSWLVGSNKVSLEGKDNAKFFVENLSIFAKGTESTKEAKQNAIKTLENELDKPDEFDLDKALEEVNDVLKDYNPCNN